MKDSIDALGENFERLLRWVYPGFLLTLLLYLAKPYLFEHIAFNRTVGLSGLIIGCVVIGFIVYILQTNFLQQIFIVIFTLCKWSHSQVLRKHKNFIHELFYGEAEIIVKHSGKNYSSYLWSTCHMMFITCWLTFLFLGVKDSHSFFSCWFGWILSINIVILLSSCFLFTKLFIADRVLH